MSDARRQQERRERGRSRRGFSIVELLIVVAVTSVGFVALLELQVASIRGLAYPAELTSAVNLGEHFLETLRMEGLEWTSSNSQNWQNLRYLGTLDENAASDDPNQWQLAFGVVGADDMFVDQAGSDEQYDRGVVAEFPARQNPRFCLQYRLSFTDEAQRMIRAEVRVLWLRDQGSWTRFRNCPLEMAETKWRGTVQTLTLTDQILINTNI